MNAIRFRILPQGQLPLVVAAVAVSSDIRVHYFFGLGVHIYVTLVPRKVITIKHITGTQKHEVLVKFWFLRQHIISL